MDKVSEVDVYYFMGFDQCEWKSERLLFDGTSYSKRETKNQGRETSAAKTRAMNLREHRIEQKRRNYLHNRLQWSKQWGNVIDYVTKCDCGKSHLTLLLTNGRIMCPIIYWARTCQVLLHRKGRQAMEKWMEEHPLTDYLRYDETEG